ncbi:peptide-methionine (S)-S-oxide reductase MsrA [Kiritimatiella glycovorans]
MNRAENPIATFAAGCFWGVEAEFRRIPGVVDTEVGYTGGHTENPSYRDVCRGDTGHAEAVRVWYDSSRVRYRDLLDVFWRIHNPTTLNRQGADVGSQYRSAIFTHSPEQEREAQRSLQKEDRNTRRDIVTQIEPAGPFYRAEEYHQQYTEKHGGGCHL